MNWRLRAVELGIRLTGIKRRMESVENSRADIERRMLRPPRYAPPAGVVRRSRVTVTRVDGVPVYTLATVAPHQVRSRVLYLHGGAYTGEISLVHWRFVRFLADRCSAEIRVPIYHLAPLVTAERTVAQVTGLLSELTSAERSGPVVVMGDSAGGGMALAVAQQLRAGGRRQPSRIVLISPWLDVTMGDARQEALEARDVMLARAGLAESGRLYAGAVPTTDPRVSPLYGELSGLAPIDVFIGTADLLYADALRLSRLCRAASAPCRLHEAPEMPHVYPLLPLLREGAEAREAIARLVHRAGTEEFQRRGR